MFFLSFGPSIPKIRIERVRFSEEIIPLPIVFATLVETNAPAILNTLAKIKAFVGERALVAVTVAIELARSLAPFKKSKIKAKTTISVIKNKVGIILSKSIN